MKISRSSWHYKLYQYIENATQGPRYLIPWADVTRKYHRPPKNLCPYVWSLVLGVVGVSVFAALVLVVGTILSPLWLVYMALSLSLRGLKWIDEEVRMPKIAVDLPERKHREKKPKKESLILAMIKAHKEKVCPQLEVID